MLDNRQCFTAYGIMRRVCARVMKVTNAQEAITFPATDPASWPLTATAYLVPWFNGGCPWTMEYVSALSQSIPLICLWAFDHLCLFSWPLPLPKEISRAAFQ